MKPFSPACERNQEPILAVLADFFADRKRVLEIGSGTGQHAAFFAPRLPFLTWQTSDRREHHAGILAWHAESEAANFLAPIYLDVEMDPWPRVTCDALFSANTLHIMSQAQGWRMIEKAAALLPPGGKMALYGPFHFEGAPTGVGNERFDAMLRASDPLSGIRDFEAVRDHAQAHGLAFFEEVAMPADNRILTFVRQG
ncbi:DUF938 domain-containing protein [Acanthopleuribacter pedis]|uniref:DUF938 domain-containing protein n=1 Tax=Acanthopleuribacter pedis TaxID=442870 RepID=A0A8J7U238_9BACT|nr:DUF938 domain-containing protein [Acanthopleuribacter pedis]